jgi:hypothetical protein
MDVEKAASFFYFLWSTFWQTQKPAQLLGPFFTPLQVRNPGQVL